MESGPMMLRLRCWLRGHVRVGNGYRARVRWSVLRNEVVSTWTCPLCGCEAQKGRQI